MEIKEVKLAEKLRGCRQEDRIIIAISPSDAQIIEDAFKELACNEKDYVIQGVYRRIKDFFAQVRGAWEENVNKYRRKR